jgi:hypothetical protein
MNRYLIETPHSPQECFALVQQIHAMGYLHHFDWGCESGEHTGWAIIEAEDENLARLAVPPLVRTRARVIKLTKYDAGQIGLLHQNTLHERIPYRHARSI